MNALTVILVTSVGVGCATDVENEQPLLGFGDGKQDGATAAHYRVFVTGATKYAPATVKSGPQFVASETCAGECP